MKSALLVALLMGAAGVAGLADAVINRHHAVRPHACRAIDGDTADCDGERIRLTAIDAPEMPGHCRPGRACAPGDPFASTAHLAFSLGIAHSYSLVRLGSDRYRRTVGDLYADGVSLSCLQLASGNAVYWARYDQGGRIKRECGL